MALACISLLVFALATVTVAVLGFCSEYIGAVSIGGAPVVRSRYVRTAATTAALAITLAAALLMDASAPENVHKAL